MSELDDTTRYTDEEDIDSTPPPEKELQFNVLSYIHEGHHSFESLQKIQNDIDVPVEFGRENQENIIPKTIEDLLEQGYLIYEISEKGKEHIEELESWQSKQGLGHWVKREEIDISTLPSHLKKLWDNEELVSMLDTISDRYPSNSHLSILQTKFGDNTAKNLQSLFESGYINYALSDNARTEFGLF